MTEAPPQRAEERAESALDLAGWTPFDLIDRPGGTVVRWIDLGPLDFSDPFFRDTVARRRAKPDARIVETGLQPLCDLPHRVPHLDPSGFVFHTSRAGSTLLSNALKAMDGNLVLVEPNPVNQMLGSPARLSQPALWDRLFTGLIACLGQPRRPAQQRFFIKFSSHNALQIADVQRNFPTVPWIFLYREPREIIESALKDPPGWLAHFDEPEKAEALFEIPAAQVRRMDRVAFCAAVLQRLFDAGLTAARGNGCLLNYRHLLPDSIVPAVRRLDLSPNETEAARMRELFAFDAKSIRKRPFERSEGRSRAAGSEVLCPDGLRARYWSLEERAFVP